MVDIPMAFGLSSFFKKSISTGREESYLGIDIGASAVKIVELKGVRGVPTLATYGELQLGPYENTDIGTVTHLPSERLVEAVVDILREAGAVGTQALFAFPYSASFTNIISVPTVDEKQIATMVPVEARKYIPAALSKVALDWLVLGVNQESRETEVLLSAIYNEAIGRYNTVIQRAGLQSVGSEIELFSTIRAVVAPTDTSVAVLDMGASSTRLYIVEGGFIRKTHSVPMSGMEMTLTLKNTINVDFVTAEERKRTLGLAAGDENPAAQKALTQALNRGLRELHIVMSRHEEEHGTKITKIILSGGASLLQGLPAHVSDMFGRPVVQGAPFDKVAYPAFLEDTLKSAGPSFAVAVGVALQGFANQK